MRGVLLPLRIHLSRSSSSPGASSVAGHKSSLVALAISLLSRKMSSLSARSDANDCDASSSTNGPKESTIRKMTRLAIEYNAVNLSQGFPNEGPPWEMKLALAHAVLSGQPFVAAAATASSTTTSSDDNDNEEYHNTASNVERLKKSIVEMILSSASDQHQQQQHSDDNRHAHHDEQQQQQQSIDELNQYSPPMGRLDLRLAICDYYQRFYQYDSITPDDITVTLGATEAFASALRTIGRPGDKCVIFEPFHELYPSQCQIFYLQPVYVTLRVSSTPHPCWELDFDELEQALQNDAKILLLNSPHNPTGKVFTKHELAKIVQLCLKYDVYIITDEIYEHMVYNNNTDNNNNNIINKHYLIPKEFPEIAHKTLVCNSLGKSASATGWRLGWCLHPPHVRDTFRGIHDQLCVMSPHPMQYATMTSYMTLPDSYFYNLCHRYERRVTKLAAALSSAGFQVVVPQGAYYLFVNYRKVAALSGMPTSMQAAMYLLQTIGVACVPGETFYGSKNNPGNDYLRFAACRSDSDLEEASIRLSKLK